MILSKDKRIRFIPPVVNRLTNDIPLKEDEFSYIRSLIFKKSGINLNGQKIAMVQSRLSKRLRELGISSYKEYIGCLEKEGSEGELICFINALTTNKTDFFREPGHFDYLKNTFLEEYAKNNRGNNTIYIWSAACSTGEEVYTLAMVANEFARRHINISYRILGSDIDTNILERAREGIYKKEAALDIPPQYIHRYLLRGKKRYKDYYKIADCLKVNIKFKYYNLVDYTNLLPIKFDIIFLRNVLIYFEKKTIENVVSKLASHLKPGGLLFIGHSETLNSIKHNLVSLGPAIYMKKD